MGRPKASNGDRATTERLLTAAEVEFGRAGFEGARLEDIARAAGISRPSLLYHFRSKAELYTAVVRSAFDRLSEAVTAAAIVEGSFPRKVDEMTARFLEFLEEHGALASVLLREMLDRRGPGAQLLEEAVLPLLDAVEVFVREQGRDLVPPGLPARTAILHLVVPPLVRAAAGSLARPLFGDEDHTRALARALLVKEGTWNFASSSGT